MALITLPKFNRIINLTFYKKSGIPVTIKCPLKGRKPAIEISGSFTTAGYLPAFNVTIKNLYMNLQDQQYTRLKVEAGYEGDTVTFEGVILTMYQQEPGPEGSTVIQCQQGQLQNYLDATVQMDYMPGTPIALLLAEIAGNLGVYGVHTGIKAGGLVLKDRFQYDGTARGAMAKLEAEFKDEALCVYPRDNILCAICIAHGDFVKAHVLQYMSAPPQENVGDASGTYYTTITAPWEPKLQKGDLLIIPSKVYVRNFTVVGGVSKTQKIEVTSLSFHFGTTGGTNSMTVQGFVVR